MDKANWRSTAKYWEERYESEVKLRQEAEEALATIRRLLGVDKLIEEAISELRGEIFNG